MAYGVKNSAWGKPQIWRKSLTNFIT
jgi:hypothetical protein